MSRQANPFQSVGLAASAAVLVVNVTQPLDFIKTRRQVDSKFNIRLFVHNEGFIATYKGIQAAWCREAAYTSFKLGAYGPLRDAIGGKDHFGLKFLAGAMTGCFGSILGNPFDLLKTRLMTTAARNVDPTAPQGMIGISRDLYTHQGVGGFYRGLQANILRAVFLNGVKMSVYDGVKGRIHTYTGWKRTDLRCQLTSSFFAGFLMAVTISPFDFLRTTFMNQPGDRKIYKSLIHAAYHIFKSQGPLAFYRGFVMIWGRFVPQATMQLVAFDTLLSLCGFRVI